MTDLERKEYLKAYEKTPKRIAWRKKWALENREKMLAKYKRYREAHPDRRKISFDNWSRKNPNYNRQRTLRKYNLTEADYLKIFEEQKGVCKICSLPELNKRLVVDHNHTTGKVRSLLCDNCNRGLGLFKENIGRLLSAIEYIKNESN